MCFLEPDFALGLNEKLTDELQSSSTITLSEHTMGRISIFMTCNLFYFLACGEAMKAKNDRERYGLVEASLELPPIEEGSYLDN